MDSRGLSDIMPPLSADVPDMLELPYELESNAAKWYATSQDGGCAVARRGCGAGRPDLSHDVKRS